MILLLLKKKNKKRFQEEIKKQVFVANFPNALRSQHPFNTSVHSLFQNSTYVQIREYLVIMNHLPRSSLSTGKCEHMTLSVEHANTQKDEWILQVFIDKPYCIIFYKVNMKENPERKC